MTINEEASLPLSCAADEAAVRDVMELARSCWEPRAIAAIRWVREFLLSNGYSVSMFDWASISTLISDDCVAGVLTKTPLAAGQVLQAVYLQGKYAEIQSSLLQEVACAVWMHRAHCLIGHCLLGGTPPTFDTLSQLVQEASPRLQSFAGSGDRLAVFVFESFDAVQNWIVSVSKALNIKKPNSSYRASKSIQSNAVILQELLARAAELPVRLATHDIDDYPSDHPCGLLAQLKAAVDALGADECD